MQWTTTVAVPQTEKRGCLLLSAESKQMRMHVNHLIGLTE